MYQWSGNTDYNLGLFAISDTGIGGLLPNVANDYNVSRNEMIGILRNAKDSGIINNTELSELRTVVAGTRPFMVDYVFNLSNKVVNLYDPNIRSGIGNLVGNDPATRMENLIGKHFLGTYRPAAANGCTYQYVSGSLFQNGISYGDIAQGALGDCYYLAALAGTAFRTPNTIEEMFTDNGDNTYTVRFYNNGVADYVTVDRYLPTYSDGTSVYASWNGGSRFESNNELWVVLAEKAYAQINEAGWIGHGTTNSYTALEGGWTHDSLQHIAASNSIVDWSLQTDDFNSVVNAFNEGATVFLYGYPSFPNTDSYHAYTMVGYNSSNGLFSIYNPWGHVEYYSWDQIIQTNSNGISRFNIWGNTI